MKHISRSTSIHTLLFAGSIAMLCFTASAASRQAYRQSNLVADQSGVARFTDPNLVNAWGVVPLAGRVVVADNHSGMITFYNPAGHPSPLTVNVPTPDSDTGGAVTGLAWNPARGGFRLSQGSARSSSTLLLDTEDGTILGWSPIVNARNAVIAVDNSAAGASYKGLAVAATAGGARLYAADFGTGVVEMYDEDFHLVKTFTDTGLPAGYVPFGITVIGGRLFVSYAFKASPTDGDETAGPGLGYVDEFDLAGNLVRQVASQGTLNAPWGMAIAPKNFGRFAGALLVGNFGDGAINVYNAKTGAALGQLQDRSGNVIHIDGLWGLTSGPSGFLYFTAGPNDENSGLMGILRPDSGK